MAPDINVGETIETDLYRSNEMVGTTLLDIRNRIASLATASGDYFLRCARTGDRPVPAAGERFPDRETAREAARATRQYRSTLRQYDPRVPYYDVVVCEEAGPMISPRELCDRGAGTDWTITEPVVNSAEPGDDRRQRTVGSEAERVWTAEWRRSEERSDGTRPDHHSRTNSRWGESGSRALIECSHRVAAAVFEALSERGHDSLERAVMDAYLDHAETIDRPDELCCCLLESMAGEIESHLGPDAQRSLFDAAANRMSSPAQSDDWPDAGTHVEASFTALSAAGVVDGYEVLPTPTGPEAGDHTVAVECTSYALDRSGGRLPVVPIVLVLSRVPEWPPATVTATDCCGDWRLRLNFSPDAGQGSLATAPVLTES